MNYNFWLFEETFVSLLFYFGFWFIPTHHRDPDSERRQSIIFWPFYSFLLHIFCIIKSHKNLCLQRENKKVLRMMGKFRRFMIGSWIFVSSFLGPSIV